MIIAMGSAAEVHGVPNSFASLVDNYLEDKVGISNLRIEIAHLLHKVGMIGIRAPDAYERVHFSFSSGVVFNKEDLSEDHEITISPMLWQAFKNQNVYEEGSVL